MEKARLGEGETQKLLKQRLGLDDVTEVKKRDCPSGMANSHFLFLGC